MSNEKFPIETGRNGWLLFFSARFIYFSSFSIYRYPRFASFSSASVRPRLCVRSHCNQRVLLSSLFIRCALSFVYQPLVYSIYSRENDTRVVVCYCSVSVFIIEYRLRSTSVSSSRFTPSSSIFVIVFSPSPLFLFAVRPRSRTFEMQ